MTIKTNLSSCKMKTKSASRQAVNKLNVHGTALTCENFYDYSLTYSIIHDGNIGRII